MAEGDIITIRIGINGSNLVFDNSPDPRKTSFDEDSGNVDFNTRDNDSADNNVRIELGIAKIFHKVLRFIKDDPDLFQKQDFELLGEMLSKILFGKKGDLRGGLMDLTYQSIRTGITRNCRIILCFDARSNLANLPWEYVLYRFRKGQNTVYLSATDKLCFNVYRRFPIHSFPCVHPLQQKLFVITLLSLEGNNNAKPRIDSRVSIRDDIQTLFQTIEKENNGVFIRETIDNPTLKRLSDQIKEVLQKWKAEFGFIPAYVLHYVGHSRLGDQVGQIVLKTDEGKSPEWVTDKLFAARISEEVMGLPAPSLMFFQSCDSAKVGVLDNQERGMAAECTKVKIPAVVGMQNDIDVLQSSAFYYKVYEALLAGDDISEAVTRGRVHLGKDENDFSGKELQAPGEPYANYYFGSPVLFITTDEPVRMMQKLVRRQDTGTGTMVIAKHITDVISRNAKLEEEDRAEQKRQMAGAQGIRKAGVESNEEDSGKSNEGDWGGRESNPSNASI